MSKFIFTLGQGHEHIINGIFYNKDCVAVVNAETEREARLGVFKLFGPKWCFSYTEKEFDEDGSIRYFPRGKIELKIKSDIS